MRVDETISRTTSTARRRRFWWMADRRGDPAYPTYHRSATVDLL